MTCPVCHYVYKLRGEIPHKRFRVRWLSPRGEAGRLWFWEFTCPRSACGIVWRIPEETLADQFNEEDGVDFLVWIEEIGA